MKKSRLLGAVNSYTVFILVGLALSNSSWAVSYTFT